MNEEPVDDNEEQPDSFGRKESGSYLKNLKDLVKAFPKITHWWSFASSKYFVKSSMVKHFLGELDFKSLPKTNFIIYSKWNDYYTGQRKEFDCIQNGQRKKVVVPYFEVIDFISHPTTTISIDENISTYEPKKEIKILTDKALEKYLAEKPKTTDGPIVRLASLEQISECNFHCTLQKSSYYEQIRTNLTLDFNNKGTTSLRVKDLADGNQLRSFDQSMMVNSIGVSSVVYFSKGTRSYFFMKLRQQSTGIFETMFGTTSGVLELSEETPKDLIKLASDEMLREFCEETGVPKDEALENVIITPLALTRELIRGGKPQFFFLIEIPDEVEEKFKAYFKSSQDGLNEFDDNPFEKAKGYITNHLSPEFAVNLYYAYRYFNVQNQLSDKPIKL